MAEPNFRLVFAIPTGQFYPDKETPAHLPGLAKTRQDLNHKNFLDLIIMDQFLLLII